MKVIILAAGRGSRMSSETDIKPKCLVNLHGKPLIEHILLKVLRYVSQDEVFIVCGYRAELLEYLGIKLIYNSEWSDTNIMGSLFKADEILETNDALVLYSDIFFEESAIELSLSSPVPAVISLMDWEQIWSTRFSDPLVDVENFRIDGGKITQIGGRVQNINEVQGQFAGIFSIDPITWRVLKNLPNFSSLDTTSALNQIISLGITLNLIPYSGAWGEFDSISDVVNQEKFL